MFDRVVIVGRNGERDFVVELSERRGLGRRRETDTSDGVVVGDDGDFLKCG